MSSLPDNVRGCFPLPEGWTLTLQSRCEGCGRSQGEVGNRRKCTKCGRMVCRQECASKHSVPRRADTGKTHKGYSTAFD